MATLRNLGDMNGMIERCGERGSDIVAGGGDGDGDGDGDGAWNLPFSQTKDLYMVGKRKKEEESVWGGTSTISI